MEERSDRRRFYVDTSAVAHLRDSAYTRHRHAAGASYRNGLRPREPRFRLQGHGCARRGRTRLLCIGGIGLCLDYGLERYRRTEKERIFVDAVPYAARWFGADGRRRERRPGRSVFVPRKHGRTAQCSGACRWPRRADVGFGIFRWRCGVAPLSARKFFGRKRDRARFSLSESAEARRLHVPKPLYRKLPFVRNGQRLGPPG